MAIFEKVGDNPIFINRGVFSKDYVPKSILHRDEQIRQIANGLRYILNGQCPTDQIIHGKRGTGKTLVARHVADELGKATTEVKVFYVSLKQARTGFMALEKIIEKVIGRGKRGESLIRGKSFDDGCYTIYNYISTLKETYVLFILDEVNSIENPDVFLHSLLRINEVHGDINNKQVSYIFISNDPEFPSGLSEGTRSSYSGVTKRVFPIYDAVALRDILKERVQEGLRPGVCDETIISLCAAFGAQEDGDARETIKLLEKAAEIAVEDNATVIIEDHVKGARQQIEFDGLAEVIKTLPTQLKAIALACIWDVKRNMKNSDYVSTTGSVYNVYKDIVRIIGIDVLTQRRVTDLLSELAGIGYIDAIIKSEGRMGRTKHVTLLTSFEMENVLLEDYRLKDLRLHAK